VQKWLDVDLGGPKEACACHMGVQIPHAREGPILRVRKKMPWRARRQSCMSEPCKNGSVDRITNLISKLRNYLEIIFRMTLTGHRTNETLHYLQPRSAVH